MVLIIMASCILLGVSIGQKRRTRNECMIAVLCILFGMLSLLKGIPQLNAFSSILSLLTNAIIVAIPFLLAFGGRKVEEDME